MARSWGGGVRRSPVVVGREREREELVAGVRAARSGRAACVFLAGEAGVGKTRLLGEVADQARQRGLAVLAGRAPVMTPVAYSVLAEALRSWLRGHGNDVGAIPPFDAGLRLLLPEWPIGPGGGGGGGGGGDGQGLTEGQLRLLAVEGVVRLLRAVAGSGGGAVLLLDDLHAADADSLEALRYLATAAPDGVFVVGALRSGEGARAAEVVRSLARDGVAEVIDIEPLGRREVADLLAALLDTRAPDELLEDVVARTDGVPLLVEELVDAHLRARSVEVDDHGARWRGGPAVVSRTVRDMVEGRLRELTDGEREVLVAGAALGDFGQPVLSAVVRQPPDTAARAVVRGTDAGLLETVGGSVNFRHGVVRDAVLDGTPPHVLVAFHTRAAAVLADDRTSPVALERGAYHLAAIGDHAAAAASLVAASRLCCREHALQSAETLARAAAAQAGDGAGAAEAADALATALAAQGRWAEALAVDEAATGEHGETAPRWLRMATCAAEAAEHDRARALLERAVGAGGASPATELLDGRLSIIVGDAARALAVADRLLALTDPGEDPATSCIALDLRARALDYIGDRAGAQAAWEREIDLAVGAALTDARLRAVVQLAKIELFDGRPATRLFEARDLTRAAGALVEQAWAEENLAIGLTLQGDPTAGAAVAAEGVRRCRDLRLDALPYLLAALGGAETFLGGDYEATFDEAERLEPNPYLLMHTRSIRADVALRRGRYDEAVALLEGVVETMRAQPGGVPMDAPCYLVWALLAAGRRDEAPAALAFAKSVPDLARWYGRPLVVAAAEALLAQSPTAMDAAFASATGTMPFELALLRVLAAELLDTPERVRWLREALDAYEAAGAEADAAHVRRLLRRAGGAVPRRRKAEAAVPPVLAERGVTRREAEVLVLVGEGLSNATIAERLFLSVRTVETHVSSLLSKLAAESRGQLIAMHAGLREVNA